MRDMYRQVANREEGVVDARTLNKAKATKVLWKQRARANATTLVLSAWLLASCGNGPVAAETANPEVIFDGTSCTYDGPTKIEKGLIEFTLTNQSDTPIVLYALLYDDPADYEADLDSLAVGADADVTDPLAPHHVGLALNAQPGDRTITRTSLDIGDHILQCGRTPDDASLPDHFWRAATIEINP